MNFWSCLYYLLFSIPLLVAQEQKVEVAFVPLYNNTLLTLNSDKYQYNEKKIAITRFKYYITNIELYLNDKQVWKEVDSYHLVDHEKTATTKLILNIPKGLDYNQIKYQLGVDSLTNVSGAMGGDLDPTKGMYWAWNSGYINLKLEGIYEDCPTRKNKFQFHIGGYADNLSSIQKIVHVIGRKDHIFINVLVGQFLSQLNLVEEHSLMSPSKKAVGYSRLAASIFSVKIQNE